MGSDKALLPWPPGAQGSTLLTASISALKPFTESVIVVAGNNFESLAPLAAAHGALIVQNPAPERGQFSSLQTGLRELAARGYNAAMITLVDCPPLSAASMQSLCTAFDRARGMWGVVPECGGRRGHPLLAGRELIDAFLGATVTSSARAVRREHTELIESVPVVDVLGVDVNTPEQYEALSASADKLP